MDNTRSYNDLAQENQILWEFIPQRLKQQVEQRIMDLNQIDLEECILMKTEKAMKYILFVQTDKGWIEEKSYTNKQDAEYYLAEWKEEFPNCNFKIEEQRNE